MGRHFYKGQSKISLADKMGEERKVKSVGCPLFPAAAAVEGGTSNGYCLVGPDLIHSSFSSLSHALPFFSLFHLIYPISSTRVYAIFGHWTLVLTSSFGRSGRKIHDIWRRKCSDSKTFNTDLLAYFTYGHIPSNFPKDSMEIYYFLRPLVLSC